MTPKSDGVQKVKLTEAQREILTLASNASFSPWRMDVRLDAVRRLMKRGLLRTNSGLPLAFGKMMVSITESGRKALVSR